MYTRKSGFLTFCFSFLPGGGQMYQGYLKRGFSLLIWFFGVIFIMVATNVGVLGIFLPVIWCFAFFDSLQLRSLTPQQLAAFPDDYIPPKRWLEENLLPSGRKTRSAQYIGIGLIVLGALILYSNFVQPFFYRLADHFPFIYDILYNLPHILTALAILALGVWILLRGKNQPAAAKDASAEAGAPFIPSPPPAAEPPAVYTAYQAPPAYPAAQPAPPMQPAPPAPAPAVLQPTLNEEAATNE